MEPESIHNAYLTLARARTALAMSEVNLSPEQYVALSFIHEEGHTQAGKVAKYLTCTPAVVTGLVDRLERAKLVKRGERSGDDRRAVSLTVTDAGRDLIRTAEKVLREAVAA